MLNTASFLGLGQILSCLCNLYNSLCLKQNLRKILIVCPRMMLITAYNQSSLFTLLDVVPEHLTHHIVHVHFFHKYMAYFIIHSNLQSPLRLASTRSQIRPGTR